MKAINCAHKHFHKRATGGLKTTAGRETRRLMKDREVVKSVTEVTTLKGGRMEAEVMELRSRDKLGDSL